MRRTLALSAYMMAHPDLNPRGAGVHLGNNNMSINRSCALAYYAGDLPDHLARQGQGQVVGLDVARHGGHRRDRFERGEDGGVADVAGVDDMGHAAEQLHDGGVEITVGIADDADPRPRRTPPSDRRGRPLRLGRLGLLGLPAAGRAALAGADLAASGAHLAAPGGTQHQRRVLVVPLHHDRLLTMPAGPLVPATRQIGTDGAALQALG